MELEIKRERITNLVVKRRADGKGLGGRRGFTDSQILSALPLIKGGGRTTTQVSRDLGVAGATLYRRLRELQQAFIT